MGLGFWEVFLIIGVIMMFFGSQKLPQLTKSFGEAKKEFKKSLYGQRDLDKNTHLIDVTESRFRGRK